MARKASAKADSGGGKKVAKRAKASNSGGSKRSSRSDSTQSDAVDAVIKLLQSPLVIDLLAVGATAALAAITEQRSGRAQDAVGSSKKVLKAAGKAAAAAVGRRIATEFDEIKSASKRANDDRKTNADATA